MDQSEDNGSTDVDLPTAKALLRINRARLNWEYERFSADLFYWHTRLALADEQEGLAELDKRATEGALYETFRTELEVVHGKKPSEKMVEHAVRSSDAYGEAYQGLLTARRRKTRLRGLIDAMHAKRDMLISLGAQLRAEMQGDPTIRDEIRSGGKSEWYNGEEDEQEEDEQEENTD